MLLRYSATYSASSGLVHCYALYHWVCSVLLNCVDMPFLQIPATNTCCIYHCPNWPAIQLNSENNASCSHKVLRTVIAWRLVDIRVLDSVITTVIVEDVDWFVLRMEAADSSDTSVSVTLLRVPDDLSCGELKSCICYSLNRLILYYQELFNCQHHIQSSL